MWGDVFVILVPSSGFVPSPMPWPPSQCHDHVLGPMATIPQWLGSALTLMGGGEMMGEKDLDQARRAPWHHVMLSPWSSSSGWKGVLLLDFKVVWHGKVIFMSGERQWIPKPFPEAWILL